MGKVYYSPFAAYGLHVRDHRDIFDNGVRVDEVRALDAEFATHGPEVQYETADGGMDVAAQIAGHYFDLDVAAEQNEWTDEEKRLVEKKLDWACDKFPSQVRLHTKPAAPLPWPTYDETNTLQIARIAQATGMVAQAIAYEKENKNRDGILRQLSEALDSSEPESVGEPTEEEVEDLVPAA